MKKILLTGSTGFIGSAILSKLSKKYIIYCINRKKIKKQNINKNIKVIYYRNLNQLNLKLNKISVDAVIHCATHYKKNHKFNDIKKFSESNLIFGNIILENVQAKIFVNFTTVWENYNGIKNNFFNLYSVFKRGFSNLIHYYKKKHPKTKFYNLFVSDTFGDGDNREKIINVIKNNYKRNKTTKIISSNLYLNLINVDDILNALDIILQNKCLAGDYNLVNPKNIRISEIVSKFNSQNKKKLKIKWLSKKLLKEKIYKKKVIKNWHLKNSRIEDVINIISK